MSRYGLVVAWAIVIAFFSVLRPSTFFTVGNFQDIAGSQAVLVVLTMGLIIPFSAGEFDISVAGVASISLVIIGWLNVIHGVPIVWAIFAALGAGLLTGAVNAFFVVAIGVDSIVVTLGTGTILYGASTGVSSSTNPSISSALVSVIRDPFLGIPHAFFYALALTALLWYVFSLTPLGRYIYFVGAGREVARLSGVRVEAIRVGAFLASGLISALAGVVLAGILGASDPNVGADYLLPAFAAVFLGATAVSPGRFNPWGSFIAVYFLVTGITGLELLGLSGWIEQVFYGASLVLAVALARVAARRKAR